MDKVEVPSSVSKVTVGSDTLWQNSDGWVPLKLPDGVTGRILFKDAGDNQAFLLGQIIVNFSSFGTIYPILVPPEGYKFVYDNWKGEPTIKQHNIIAYEVNDANQIIYSSQYPEPVYNAGTVGFRINFGYTQYKGGPLCIMFSSLLTGAFTNTGEIAVKIGIQKV